jgi:hypothetical protein
MKSEIKISLLLKVAKIEFLFYCFVCGNVGCLIVHGDVYGLEFLIAFTARQTNEYVLGVEIADCAHLCTFVEISD